MKAWMVVTIMAVTGSAGYARHTGPEAGTRVVVCSDTLPLEGVSFAVAHMRASQMFAEIGIRLTWHGNQDCPAGALRISLSSVAPSAVSQGKLAYALPYEGTHIVVFLDRVLATVPRSQAAGLLAHVFAHEIAHILQGYGGHSASGVMKAKWERLDFETMCVASLPFSREDIDMIHQGIACRRMALTAPAAR